MSRKQLVVALLGALVLAAPAWAQRKAAGAQSPSKQTTKSGRYPVPMFTVNNQVGSVLVEGGEARHPFLLRCHRQSGECELIEADLMEPEGVEPFIHIGLPFTYTILRWDADGIVAQSDEPICITDRLVINFADKSAVLIKSPKKPVLKPLVPCEDF